MPELHCKRCGSMEIIPIKKGPHITGYCGDCNKYIKHLSSADLEALGITSHCSTCGQWLPFCDCKEED